MMRYRFIKSHIVVLNRIIYNFRINYQVAIALDIKLSLRMSSLSQFNKSNRVKHSADYQERQANNF